jgi:hypothetical protein
MLTHPQDIYLLLIRLEEGTAVFHQKGFSDEGEEHAGTRELSKFPYRTSLLHAFSTRFSEVHDPMSQRVCALTFLRYTCPRGGGR